MMQTWICTVTFLVAAQPVPSRTHDYTVQSERTSIAGETDYYVENAPSRNSFVGSSSAVRLPADRNDCCHPTAIWNRHGACRNYPRSGMPQHLRYYPAAHGYYYFHPYHVAHLRDQQEIAKSHFGVDRRTPYSNRLLEIAYANLIRKRAARPVPWEIPNNPAEPLPHPSAGARASSTEFKPMFMVPKLTAPNSMAPKVMAPKVTAPNFVLP